MKNHYIVIMAGGSGTRLWPLSRSHHPKQFQNLTNEKQTLLQETLDRVKPLVENLDQIFISTTEKYADIVKEQLPEIAEENIIIEPCGRDTAPAMALLTYKIHQKDPDAVITTTPSDHAITNPEAYISTVQTAFSVIDEYPEKFGLIGITPTEASTELGYIRIGKEINENFKKRVFNAMEFKEKPNKETAEKYFAHWSYLWNAAYFVYKTETFINMIKQHAPYITEVIEKLENVQNPEKIQEIYCSLPKEPIDTVILEKLSAKERFVVPADLKWSDVGNWRTLHDFYKNSDDVSNITRGNVVNESSENCMIFGSEGKTIATLGLEDVVVIDTDDAILIAHRDHAHDVKKVIESLKKKNRNDLL